MAGTITLGIVIVFIIFLSFNMYYQTYVVKSEKKQWPPYISKCPEYWNVDSTDKTKCVNSTNRNTVGETTGSLSVYDGENLDELKQQQDVSYRHWDGISN